MNKVKKAKKDKIPLTILEKKLLRIKIIGVLLAVFIFSGTFGFISVLSADKQDSEKKKIEILEKDKIIVEIPLGAGSTKISEILYLNHVISFPFIYKMMSRFNGYDGTYKFGTHIVSKKLSYIEIMDQLSQNPEIKRVTFPEGMTFKQISQKIVEQGMADMDTLIGAAANIQADYKFMQYLPSNTELRMEGYLFPDTYDFNLKASATEIFSKMLAKFDSVFKPEYYVQAEKLGMTPHQIITLASIIEKESKHSDERKTIAGIFYNRLKSTDKSMRKLQSCATIQYILLGQNGIVKPKITDADTSIQSPYNTYINEGLPPTPICAPSEDSILAALYPDSTDYMYFVAMGDADGHNEFTRTYKEHLAAKVKYGT